MRMRLDSLLHDVSMDMWSYICCGNYEPKGYTKEEDHDIFLAMCFPSSIVYTNKHQINPNVVDWQALGLTNSVHTQEDTPDKYIG